VRADKCMVGFGLGWLPDTDMELAASDELWKYNDRAFDDAPGSSMC
jgi:hypothetical protein